MIDIPSNIDEQAPNYPEISHTIALYANNYIIRKYSGWADDEPLPISIQHSYSYGPGLMDWFINPFSHLWVYGDREYEYFVSNGHMGSRQTWKCGHPILYLDFENSHEKHGSLAAPRIATGNLVWDKVEEYFISLLELPAEMHPITVSLPHAFMKYKDICESFGLPVICLGHHSHLYQKRMCETMSQFKYMVSNYLGTPFIVAQHVNCRFCYYNIDFPKVVNTSGDAVKPPVPYLDLFSLQNRDQDLEEKKQLGILLMGSAYKKTKQELKDLLNHWKNDFKYHFLKSLCEKNFKSNPRPSSKIISSEPGCYDLRKYQESYREVQSH